APGHTDRADPDPGNPGGLLGGGREYHLVPRTRSHHVAPIAQESPGTAGDQAGGRMQHFVSDHTPLPPRDAALERPVGGAQWLEASEPSDQAGPAAASALRQGG